MSTAKQLWLGFGALLGLLVVTILVLVGQLLVLQKNLQSFEMTEGPVGIAVAEIRSQANALGATILALLVIGVVAGAMIARFAEGAVLKSEARLQMALAHAESVVDTVREPLVILREDLSVHSANRPFYLLFQVTPSETEDRLFYELGNGHWDVPRLRELLEQVVPRKVQFQDFEVEREFERIGHRTMLLNGRRLFRQNDASKLILLSIEDVSIRKRLEHERESLLASERAARNEAERLNLVKHEFLATVSHELRTPLQAILGWSQLLQSGKLAGDAARQAAETIATNARTQSQLIEDLLDVSRIVSAKLVLETRLVRLSEVIEQAVHTVQPAANAKEVSLHRSFDPQCGPVIGDSNRLQQVVWNLLSNAIKFTPKGGQVQVTLAAVNSAAQITVRDTGQGMKPDFLPHIFERFRQADASTTRRHGGLGLGLAIVRHLVELHGGHVHADSPGEGQGSIFTVMLPLAAARTGQPIAVSRQGVNADIGPSEIENPDAEISAFGAQNAAIAGIQIVVVDDDPAAREIVARILHEEGARVATAASVVEAIPLLERFQPDILVSDISLPDQDGYELIRHIRGLPKDRGGRIPAVALTALTRPEDRERALAAGYQLHVAKPVEPADLIAIVARLVHRYGG